MCQSLSITGNEKQEIKSSPFRLPKIRIQRNQSAGVLEEGEVTLPGVTVDPEGWVGTYPQCLWGAM